MKLDEKKLIEKARPYFEKCRDGDMNHAIRVVKWVKELGKDHGDIDLLVTAAYLHDIGWSGVMPKGLVDLGEMLQFEAKANKNTKKFVTKILKNLEVKKSEIETIIRLIKVADKHESNKGDEEIIVDADNLSKLCLDHLQEKYIPESYDKVIKKWEKEFPKRIKTQYGKGIYPKLLTKIKESVDFNI